MLKPYNRSSMSPGRRARLLRAQEVWTMKWIAKVTLRGGGVRHEGPLEDRPTADRYRAYQLATYEVVGVDLLPVYRPDRVPRRFRRRR
jgi:hypothetical protein